MPLIALFFLVAELFVISHAEKPKPQITHEFKFDDSNINHLKFKFYAAVNLSSLKQPNDQGNKLKHFKILTFISYFHMHAWSANLLWLIFIFWLQSLSFYAVSEIRIFIVLVLLRIVYALTKEVVRLAWLAWPHASHKTLIKNEWHKHYEKRYFPKFGEVSTL